MISRRSITPQHIKYILLPKFRDCTTSNDFELYLYIYIYIKFTEASHHNTLNMTQNRWM